MNKKCGFTICAKNYLAQAFTLKESFSKNNPNIPFFIFLADLISDDVKGSNEIIQLSEEIIPKWEEMAFKYNVIEFATSIKPFCISYLFKNYDYVMYLDPDIYVTNSLDKIFNYLKSKDMIITPHYNHIQQQFSGAVPEEELLFVGIYNLGFCAIKNSETGMSIVNWWKNRLENKCFADKQLALHVDQKWIDFLPGFFPDNICISHNIGCNVAIWNLHERKLIIEKNKYFVQDLVDGKKEQLYFFHFSGFDPYSTEYINRRHPNYNTKDYPSFKPLIQEYRELEYKNNYNYYSKLKYDFGCFPNGTTILPLNRRLYEKFEDRYPHPFTKEECYKFFKKNNLISKQKNVQYLNYKGSDKNKKRQLLLSAFRIAKKILGFDKYNAFISAISGISQLSNQDFLVK